MAELTYDDVRRAAQTVANTLQAAINEIRTGVQNTRGDLSRINPTDFQYRLGNIERVMTEMTQYMQRLDNYFQNIQPITNTLNQGYQNLQRLEHRLSNLEQLSTDLTRYMQILHEGMVQMHRMHESRFGRAEP